MSMQPTDVRVYNETALGVNAPIYAYYAGRIVARTGVKAGTCLDLGCGGGYLGLALARITDLDCVFLDQSPEMLACAEENIHAFGCAHRARTLRGQVQSIPMADNCVDLAISRGSLPFWEDLAAAFAEIRRVLRPGGHAYVGGGLGDPNTRAALEEQRRKLYPEWRQKKRTPPQRDNRQYIEGLTKAGIDPFEVNRSDEGLWIFFQK